MGPDDEMSGMDMVGESYSSSPPSSPPPDDLRRRATADRLLQGLKDDKAKMDRLFAAQNQSSTFYNNIRATNSNTNTLHQGITFTPSATWVDEVKAQYNIYQESKQGKEPEMIEQLIRLYTAYMAHDVRSPTPHLVGPPGVGKSESVSKLAELVGKKLHVVNVSRMSPLEIEGVQMPQGEAEAMKLSLLHNPIWTQLQEGDVVLWDEYLRGFPEVYNGLMDIFTSREVAGLVLPKVFFVAASNSVVAYDKALEDRLLHMPVKDIRKTSGAKLDVARRIVDEIGMHPEMRESQAAHTLVSSAVAPMYELLDQFKSDKRVTNMNIKGDSVRKLVGQAKLREVRNPELRALIDRNNDFCLSRSYYQYVIYLPGYTVEDHVLKAMQELAKKSDKLTVLQRINVQLNVSLMEMEEVVSNNQQSTTYYDQGEDEYVKFD